MRADRFTDKVVLITGGGRGMGKQFAIDFAKEGAIVVISGRREKLLKDTVNEIKNTGGKAAYFVSDISKPSMVEELVKNTVKNYGKIDIAVANAGVVKSGPITEVSNEDVDTVIDINVKGTFYTLREVIGQMKKQGNGSIVTLSSMSGLLGHPNQSIYCGAKAAIANMSRALALELIPFNIRVNCVCPGTIYTEMLVDFAAGLDNPDIILNDIRNAVPIKRMGTPSEVSPVVLFLASEEASLVTGSCYSVDGGYTAGVFNSRRPGE